MPSRFRDDTTSDLGFTDQAMEQVAVNRALDLALRIGELLLGNGASSLDTVLGMRTVTRAAGLRGAQVDITLTTIMISYQGSIDQVPVTRVHYVPHRDLDYSVLERIEQILRDLRAGRTSLAGARLRVDDTYNRPGRYPQWVRMLATVVMGAGVGWLLGGSWLVILIAGIAAALIEMITEFFQRSGIPRFFSYVTGGFLATVAAALLRFAAPSHSSSLLIAAMIIVLLAGMTIVTAVQDALVGYLVTSGARGLDAALTTIGIVAGVALGLGVANHLGVVMAVASYTPPNLSDLFTGIPAAALVVVGFAVSCSLPRRGWAAVAALGSLGTAVSVIAAQSGSLFGVAAGAVAIGLVAAPLADWLRLPTLILIIPALVPLLPGLRLYRGLYLLSQGYIDGWARVVEAVSIAIALAAGVLLGEYLASPLRRLTTRKLSIT
ncbi:threonine/serine exporter ThrE family protein [Naumannella halotolerans]|nr:threonine/serine exporter family protein [Naumannella halotolerans]